MKFCQESDIKGTLDLSDTRAQIPPWSPIAWRGWALGSTPPIQGHWIEVGALGLGEVLRSILPSPNFWEVRILRQSISRMESSLSLDLWSEIASALGLPEDGVSEKLLPWVDQGPEDFIRWCSNKDLKWGHLRPLAALPNPERDRLWLKSWQSVEGLSTQRGKQILELAVELELMGAHDSEIAPLKGDSSQSWEERLRKLRYPQSSTLEKSTADTVQGLEWPRNARVQWVRRGDLQGLEINLLSLSPTELERQAERLLSLARSELTRDLPPWATTP